MTRITTDPLARAAAVLLALEALAIAALAGWQVVAFVTGDVAEIGSALALVVLTVVGAVLVGAFAVAIWRGMSWGRSGAIVFQLLILAVAGGALTGSYADPPVGIALAVPALIALVLLFAVARRAAPRRDEGEAPPAE